MTNKGGKPQMDERLQRIMEEFGMAVRWQRPLLVTATCRSHTTSQERESDLVEALRAVGHPVLHYHVDKTHYDIPIALQQHPQHAQAIFMVRNLSQAGGRGYSNAYRALNMHREYLVDAGIKAVFWLSEREGRQVARFAPDFWAFRHLVMAFPELPAARMQTPGFAANRLDAASEWLRKGQELASLGCYDEALHLYRQALRHAPGEPSILLKIAGMQLAMHAIAPAMRSLKRVAGVKGLPNELRQEHMRLEILLKLEQDSPGGFLEG